MSSQEQWTEVGRYLSDLFIERDAVLDRVLRNSHEADLPPINVAPSEGKLLMLLVMMHGAKRILEIGTLGGYSTIWMARGMSEGGKIITIEADDHHAEVAHMNFTLAKMDHIIELREGNALEILPELEDPFDMIFIDADREHTADYVEWAVKLSRMGSVIVIDNVVRNGAVVDENSDDPSVQGMRKGIEALANEPRITTTAIQTVSSKGYDGFAIGIVTGE